MDDFPLYTSLKQDLPSTDLKSSQKMSFVKKVEKMDSAGKELLYVLVQAFFNDHNDKQTFDIPYKGKKNEDGSIAFDLVYFPKELRQLLYRFANKHLKKMAEDKKMATSRAV